MSYFGKDLDRIFWTLVILFAIIVASVTSLIWWLLI